MNDPAYKSMTDFLVGHGIDRIPHTGKFYLAHLITVYKFLESAGCSVDVCRAGMFHSIYGTQRFQGFKLSLRERPAIREIIGERAERLAYLNCAMDRESFDKAVSEGKSPYFFRDRISGEMVELSGEDFLDLCAVHLYDWLEQVPRSREWNYRRESYLRMAGLLGPAALEAFDRTYAQANDGN